MSFSTNSNVSWPGQSCGLVNTDPANGYPSLDTFFVELSRNGYQGNGLYFEVYDSFGNVPPNNIVTIDRTFCFDTIAGNTNGTFPYSSPIINTPLSYGPYGFDRIGLCNYQVPASPFLGGVLNNVKYTFSYYFRIPTIGSVFTPPDNSTVGFTNPNGCVKITINSITFKAYANTGVLVAQATIDTNNPIPDTTLNGYSNYLGTITISGVSSYDTINVVYNATYDFSQCTIPPLGSVFEMCIVPIDSYWCYGCCPDPNYVINFSGTPNPVIDAGNLILNNCVGNSYSANTGNSINASLNPIPQLPQAIPLTSNNSDSATFSSVVSNNNESNLSINNNQIIFTSGGTYVLTYLFQVDIPQYTIGIISYNPTLYNTSTVTGHIELNLYDSNSTFVAAIDSILLSPAGGAIQSTYILSGQTPITVYMDDRLQFDLKVNLTLYSTYAGGSSMNINLVNGYVCVGDYNSSYTQGNNGTSLSSVTYTGYWLAGVNCEDIYGIYLEPIDGDC